MASGHECCLCTYLAKLTLAELPNKLLERSGHLVCSDRKKSQDGRFATLQSFASRKTKPASPKPQPASPKPQAASRKPQAASPYLARLCHRYQAATDRYGRHVSPILRSRVASGR